MTDLEAELRSYYEEEAKLGLRRPPRGTRVGLRTEFIELLGREQRRSVLDLGAGPAGDGRAFRDAGHLFAGVDLAHGNGVLAAASGLCVVQGSIAAPPFRPASFDAGWSMSTLMHVPEDDLVDTVSAMTVPLRSGAPLLIGLWGGRRRDMVDDSNIAGQRRLFSLRPLDRNRELIGACGVVERATTWDVGPEDHEYQVFVVRVAS